LKLVVPGRGKKTETSEGAQGSGLHTNQERREFGPRRFYERGSERAQLLKPRKENVN